MAAFTLDGKVCQSTSITRATDDKGRLAISPRSFAHREVVLMWSMLLMSVLNRRGKSSSSTTETASSAILRRTWMHVVGKGNSTRAAMTGISSLLSLATIADIWWTVSLNTSGVDTENKVGIISMKGKGLGNEGRKVSRI